MKKVFLTLLIFLFTGLSSNASYMCTGYYCRTGYAHPKTRFAKPNKRFSKPQKRMAHVRPKYIYTPEYQKNIVKHQKYKIIPRQDLTKTFKFRSIKPFLAAELLITV